MVSARHCFQAQTAQTIVTSYPGALSADASEAGVFVPSISQPRQHLAAAPGLLPKLQLMITTPDAIPPRLQRLQPHMLRYWYYQLAVAQVRQRFQDAVEAALAPRRNSTRVEASGPTPAADSMQFREPMILLTDVRDVIFQTNPFAPARALASSLLGSSSGLSTFSVADGVRIQPEAERHPLFFAVEPTGILVGYESWNVNTFQGCFSATAMAAVRDVQVICSGTTLGTLSAIERYLQVMLQAMQFCVSGGQAFMKGTDQPVHIYVLHSAMLQALQRSQHSQDQPAGYQVVPPSVAALYQRFYSNLTGIPTELTSVASEHAYRQLNELSLRLFTGTGTGSDSGSGDDEVDGSAAHSAEPQVIPLPTPHEQGIICTLSMVPRERLVMTSDNQLGSEASGGKSACGVVHQYDRHARLLKHYDVEFAGLDPAVKYYDITYPDEPPF